MKTGRNLITCAAIFIGLASSPTISARGDTQRGVGPATTPGATGNCITPPATETLVTPQLAGVNIPVSVAGQATLRTFDGETVSQLLPPAGWSPLTATPEELQLYGITPRPASAGELAVWQSEWANYHSVRAFPCHSSIAIPSQSTDGRNWAGIVDYGQSNYNLIYAQAQLQTASDGPCKYDDDYSAWVGFGGYNSGTGLSQNGVVGAHYVPAAARGTTGVMGAWYEELDQYNNDRYGPGGPTFITPGIINAGDHLSMWAQYLGSGNISFSWHDYTNGNEVTFEDSGVSPVYYSGSSAEWIDEDHTDAYDVRDYGTVAWSHMNATAGSTNQYAGSWSHHDLYSSGATSHNKTQDLTDGVMQTTSTMTMNWLRCH